LHDSSVMVGSMLMLLFIEKRTVEPDLTFSEAKTLLLYDCSLRALLTFRLRGKSNRHSEKHSVSAS
jgi:hypothetical protein